MQIQIRQHGRDDAPNAMGNFSFEVTLSYRLPMKSRRQQRGTDKS